MHNDTMKWNHTALHRARANVGAFTKPVKQMKDWNHTQDVGHLVIPELRKGHEEHGGTFAGSNSDSKHPLYGGLATGTPGGEVDGSPTPAPTPATVFPALVSEGEGVASGSVSVEPYDSAWKGMQKFAKTVEAEGAREKNASDTAIHIGRDLVGAFTKPKAENTSWYKTKGGQDVTPGAVKKDSMGHLYYGGIDDGSIGPTSLGGHRSLGGQGTGTVNGSTDALNKPGKDNDAMGLTAMGLTAIGSAVAKAGGNGTGSAGGVPFVLSDKYNETEVGKWFTKEQDEAVKAAASKDPQILNHSHHMVDSAMVPRDEVAAWHDDEDLGHLRALPDVPATTPAPTAAPTFDSAAPPRPARKETGVLTEVADEIWSMFD
jgi:hypothetical protein